MSSGLPNFALSHSTRMAQQRIEARINVPRLFAAIDADPGIAGAGVVYIDSDFNVVVLREFKPICSIQPKKLLLREAPRYTSPAQYVQQVKNNPRESRIVSEAVSTGLACAGAVIGWFVVTSGSLAVPFSGGTSAVVVAIGYGAAMASGAQCLVGLGRVAAEATAPEINDRLDSEEWFTVTMRILDGVSLLGMGTAALSSVRLINISRSATGKSTREILRGLSRPERAKLTRELLKIQQPGLSAQLIRLRQLSGELPKRLSNTEIKHATLNQIRDSIGGTLGFAGSALSGNVNSIAIGLYEELAP